MKIRANLFKAIIIVVASVLLPFFAAYGLVINSPVSDWNVVSYGNNYPDYFSDQQTGQEDSDIVGTNGVPAFYTAFDDAGTPSLTDGIMAFRVRISGSAKTYWNNYLWVGFDADLDGDIDLYSSLAKDDEINLHYPGNDLNISPSTTSIQTPLAMYTATVLENDNYSFMKADDVNSLGLIKDVDNYPTGSKDGTDWFISFSINFNDLVSMLAATNIVVNQSTPMAFIAATSTQGNSLNQDINGAPKIDNTNNDQTWVALGASTNPISPDGQVPEPAAMGLVALGGIWLLIQKRVKRHRADNA